MKTCGTCKHWENGPEDYRECLAVIHDRQGMTTDDNDAFESYDWLDEEERAEIRAIRKYAAVVVDGSGYFAALKCRADFGCTLHQEKEDENGKR
jgi:hypothetical protein